MKIDNEMRKRRYDGSPQGDRLTFRLPLAARKWLAIRKQITGLSYAEIIQVMIMVSATPHLDSTFVDHVAAYKMLQKKTGRYKPNWTPSSGKQLKTFDIINYELWGCKSEDEMLKLWEHGNE